MFNDSDFTDGIDEEIGSVLGFICGMLLFVTVWSGAGFWYALGTLVTFTVFGGFLGLGLRVWRNL